MDPNRRARDAVQKQRRRQDILETAMHMFRENAYETIKMATIAHEANLAKGTLYLYFNTKEELFLTLAVHFFQDWFKWLDRGLKRYTIAKKVCGIDEFIILMKQSFQNRPELKRLLTILHTVLENNIDQASALKFKQMLYERLSYTGSLIDECLPFLKYGDGMRLLFRIHALVIGLQHLSNPSPMIQHIIKNHHMDVFNIDFEDHFVNALKDMLQGVQSRTIPV